MEVKINVDGDKVLAEFIGELDTPATDEIEAQIKELISLADKDITIDCSQMPYIASAGLRQMILIRRSCKAEGGSLTLKSLSPNVREVFEITNLDKSFRIV